MKVLHVIDHVDARIGGAMQAALCISRYLTIAGVTAELAASRGINDDLSHLARDFPEVKVHLFSKTFPQRYSGSSYFVEWLNACVRNYDVVEIHAIFSAFTIKAAQICRRNKVPYLIRPHGSLDPFDIRKHWLLKKLVGPLLIKPMLEGAEAILLTAETEASRLVTYKAAVTRVVMQLPVQCSDEMGDRQGFRTRYGIPDKAPVILFLSRIDYKKGLDILIPAFARLAERELQARLVIAGSGTPEYMGKVDRIIEAAGVLEKITKIGFVSGRDKQDAFAGADVLVLPSQNENFGIVLIEAMKNRLPVIISEGVYIHGDIVRADAGVVCARTVPALVDALRLLIENPGRRSEMGRHGHDLVVARYSPVSATRNLCDLYQRIIASRSA